MLKKRLPGGDAAERRCEHPQSTSHRAESPFGCGQLSGDVHQRDPEEKTQQVGFTRSFLKFGVDMDNQNTFFSVFFWKSWTIMKQPLIKIFFVEMVPKSSDLWVTSQNLGRTSGSQVVKIIKSSRFFPVLEAMAHVKRVSFGQELTCTAQRAMCAGVSSFGFGGTNSRADMWADVEKGPFKDDLGQLFGVTCDQIVSKREKHLS